MAAAAWSRSRGVAGVRPTKGLFSIFTLLCLVGLSSSLTNKDKLLEESKEFLQTAEKERDEVKEIDMPKLGIQIDHVRHSLRILESDAASMMTDEQLLYSPQLQEYMQGIKDYVEKAKDYVDKEEEKMRAKMEENEQAVERLKKLITSLEEQQADL